MIKLRFSLFLCLLVSHGAVAEYRATGDLGIVIERAKGSALIINTSQRSILAKIESLGDLSHASVVFSRDERYAFIFGRDGGLTKIDFTTG
jgi:Cytochrome D1 heme domain.